ncbi:trypsin-like peptidase domain-containing protein [Alienimonas californiensis]|uniref:Periplasmic serine endoprotease DegP n=1 Tax=Alienimonas californiensis TaxID=2527989 RepID=A0A517PD58_9PLAN|nr:PDZ domain-containing protein [Alienimonas californiensis]QDT17315.1 Periplasmic serine endoprotease DegP precursor [Alienimonas californiensis]
MIASPLLAVPLFAALACAGQTANALVAQEEAAFKAVAAAVGPSVVRVETLGGVDTAEGRLLASGPSTGTVVRQDGLILTSSENLAGNPTSILVRLPHGERVAAERLGEDEARQLTLLRVELPDDSGVTAAVPAEIDALRVGEWAIAVGRTFSADAVNVSVGVVSAKDRILGRAVQTDAKISPANYGGPLVDLAGRTIGILAPLSAEGGTGGVEWYDSGIGFAVPLEEMLPVLDRLAAGDTLRPGKLGVTFKSSKMDAEPVVDTVRPLSPAEEAGVLPGDRLVMVAGRAVSRPDEAQLAIGPLYAGDEAMLVVERDGAEVELKATLVAELPPWRPSDLGVLPADPPAASDEPDAEALAGVRIAHVFTGSAADGALEVGDVVTAAAGEPVETAADLRRIVSRRAPGTELSLERAEGEPVTVALGEPPAAPPEELPETIDPTADPLPADQSGRLDLEVAGFEGRGGSLLVPQRAGRGGFALLVCLPPNGAMTADDLFGRLGPAAEEHGVILMVPRPEGASGFQPGDLPFLKAAAEQMRERYAVEPVRTSLYGLGDQGATVWRIALTTDGVLRGAVTDAAPAQLPQNEPDDAVVPLLVGDPPEQSRTALRDAGYPFAVLDVPAEDPDDPNVLAPEAVEAIMRWVTTLDRI